MAMTRFAQWQFTFPCYKLGAKRTGNHKEHKAKSKYSITYTNRSVRNYFLDTLKLHNHKNLSTVAHVSLWSDWCHYSMYIHLRA